MSQGYRNLAWIALSSIGSWSKTRLVANRMTTRQRAIEMVETLAFKDARIPEIQEILSEVGLGNSLSEWEIDAIVVKVDAARSALPPEPSKSLARWVGMFAAVLGMAAWAIGLRVAGLAVILGVALMVWPKLATLKVKNPFGEKPFG